MNIGKIYQEKLEQKRGDFNFPHTPARNNFKSNTEWGMAMDEYENIEMPKFKEWKKNAALIAKDIYAEFAEALWKEYVPQVSRKQAEKIYTMAWEEGHSNGLEAVEDQYEYLSELFTD